MDTGARVSTIQESTAKELKLDYSHRPPKPLKPIGEVDLQAIGFAPQVPLRTACREEFQLEGFYVVADDQVAEKKDVYLSLNLIRQLNHLIRACLQRQRPVTPKRQAGTRRSMKH
jgi:hypothetical protein